MMTMTASRKNRFVTALAAACLVAALWPGAASGQQAGQDKPQPQEKSRLRDMAKDLYNITPEQEKKVQELRDARMKDRQAFRDQLTKAREEMRSLMKDPKANEAKIDGLIDQMAKLRADRAKTAIRDRGQWEKIFTPEQLEKMKKYRGAFGGWLGIEGQVGPGFARPGAGRWFMGRGGRGMGPRGRGSRMGRPGRFWHRPFFWRHW
jgi:Spy/CpxP family protein refolding chaperone